MKVITGNISPKSVASSGTGFVTAQNMMYRHTITVYDARTMRLVKTISDGVHLAALGFPQHPGLTHGAPVEAAFSPDGRYAYVSNYSMYGEGFGPEASDSCTPSSGYNRDYLYRVDMKKLVIDRAYYVGEVPKVVAVTPNGRYVLASNWCSWDLSVVSTWSNREVHRIPIGPYPRGIAIEPDGKRRVRGGHGRHRSRPDRPAALDDAADPDRRRPSRAGPEPERPLHLRLAERRGPRREARHPVGARGGRSRPAARLEA